MFLHVHSKARLNKYGDEFQEDFPFVLSEFSRATLSSQEGYNLEITMLKLADLAR